MLLAENGWQEVALGDVLRAQVGTFGRNEVEISGPPIMIPAPSVQPIGLAIHELAANAAVHGSLSSRGGRLTIDWRPEGRGLVLHWNEQGGPAPAKNQGRGFGNVLLAAVVEKQLGGKITRDWREEGLAMRIELPSLDQVGRNLQHKL
jgi:two-component sensor histidine kinase